MKHSTLPLFYGDVLCFDVGWQKKKKQLDHWEGQWLEPLGSFIKNLTAILDFGFVIFFSSKLVYVYKYAFSLLKNSLL